jgi:hypothetical protein
MGEDIAALCAMPFFLEDASDEQVVQTRQRCHLLQTSHSSEVLKAEGRAENGGSSRYGLCGGGQHLPPTGRQITIRGIDVLRFVEGKVVDRWARTDDLGLMQQLGLAPQMD